MKIAVITCYFDPDYIRARTLRAALKQLPDVKLVIVKNTQTGLLRYPEIIRELWRLRRDDKPDVYVLTFRGQEILPYVLWLAGKKPVWFDEFIVPMAYASGENHRKSLSIGVKYFLARRSEWLYKRWLNRVAVIFADTKAHAELSAKLSHTNLSKYLAVPVGADDQLFKPATSSVTRHPSEKFQVFYYSSGMQPLHGIPVVLEAAELLKDIPEIEFVLAGGKKPLAKAVQVAAATGAHVTHAGWIPFNDMVTVIQTSALCLGGPFGGTPQAQHVVTGKTYQFLACAVPVLVGASEATAEHFVDKQNALVVNQGNATALAKAIKWAYTHPAELKTIAQNGRKLYEKQFSTYAIARILAPLVSGS